MTQEDLGKELRENNEKIIECILMLREQRDELAYIIEKQYEERRKLETEMERITYKLCLINKSLAQRIRAKTHYDKTLDEIEGNYIKLVKNSGDLLAFIQKEFAELESMINKKTSTEDPPQEPPKCNKYGDGHGFKLGSNVYQEKVQCECRTVQFSKKSAVDMTTNEIQEAISLS